MYTLKSLDLPWTATQEKSIARDFPFIIDNSQETPELYVARTYLQFLWLPQVVHSLLAKSRSNITRSLLCPLMSSYHAFSV